jgi:hypothetical protein
LSYRVLQLWQSAQRISFSSVKKLAADRQCSKRLRVTKIKLFGLTGFTSGKLFRTRPRIGYSGFDMANATTALLSSVVAIFGSMGDSAHFEIAPSGSRPFFAANNSAAEFHHGTT